MILVLVLSLTLYKHFCQMLRDRQIGQIFWGANKSMCKFGRHSLVGMAERASLWSIWLDLQILFQTVPAVIKMWGHINKQNSPHLHCIEPVKDKHLLLEHS